MNSQLIDCGSLTTKLMVRKRVFDVVVLLAGSVIWIPVMALCAVANAVFSGFPVFYVSERRVGADLARVVKFRTMVRNADLAYNRTCVAVSGNVRFLNTPADSPLYTGIGRIIERCALTELPQLLLVVQGKMSIVGNRPLPDNVMNSLREVYSAVDDRFLTPAGMTGPVQLIGRTAISDFDRLRLEADYCRVALQSESVKLDLTIIVLTILTATRLMRARTLGEVNGILQKHSDRPLDRLVDKSQQSTVAAESSDAPYTAKTSSIIQTSKPAIGIPEAQALTRVLERGFFGMGPEVRTFEQELEAYVGHGRSVLCVDTGTAALHLAVAALGLDAGDEVLVPTLTFVASFQAVVMAGAKPVACDVDRDSGLLDLEDARRRITRRTKAIMAVHFAGNPGNPGALKAFADEYGLRVVEDAAHAFGSAADGVPVGGFGDVVCFSFDPIKNITCGQGGAVVTADATIAARVRAMRNLGIEPSRSEGSSEDFAVHGTGWRYQMSDLMAAIGRVQLARFETELKPARVRLAAMYRSSLGNLAGVTPLAYAPDVVSHIFPVRIAAHRRAAVRTALAKEGFETKIHYKPNHLLEAFSDGQRRPVAELLYDELLTLPTQAEVEPHHVSAIARILESHATSPRTLAMAGSA